MWHFKNNPELWKGYIRDFMKIKLETSPHSYPSNEAYAQAIKEKLGIELELDKIIPNPNPGLRALAKILLNSLWGKYRERGSRNQCEYVTEPQRIYEILLEDKLQDINLIFLTDEMIQVSYKSKPEFELNNLRTNIMVALYTTANARLRLYDMLDKLDKNCLYCATDSCIYVDNGENTVEIREMLGQWTNELSAGEFIEKFLTTGPKSYQTNKGKEVMKIKGFSLNHKNAQKINSQVMEQLIDGEISNVSVSNFQIIPDKQSKNLISKD